LFSSNKPITGIELEGVQVNGAALPQVSAWLQKIAADTQYPVARIGLSQGKLEADGVQLSGIGGELGFNQAGKFTQAKLHAEGGKFALDINAMPENKIQVSIKVRGSALPLLPNWVFDDLDAKGELTGDGLVITDLDSRIMGGVLVGDARIEWRSGWRAQGSLTAKTITLQNMSKALSGDMDGTARFQMQSASLSSLTEAATLEGAFAVKKGVITGVDVVETARLRSKENLPGGRTHFDELSGDLYYANGDYHFRKIKMSTGVLNATGTLDIAKQQVSGRVIADLTMRAGMGSVALQVGGTTDNPSLRTAR
ncbi:MAG: AsmA-like C-terminal region-containing protein, partial [Gallionella sp.]|nr:AsmA-like C-terminal region-containing protein [Gallionella sp.]